MDGLEEVCVGSSGVDVGKSGGNRVGVSVELDCNDGLVKAWVCVEHRDGDRSYFWSKNRCCTRCREDLEEFGPGDACCCAHHLEWIGIHG